ncbi:MAG TPA: tripartite tricarboxylate transporter substrate binding protein [Burkholderiales bacterium]|jgi:tripartite-type tricarboxylate transporter receptor subunit TctC|nr:tripartite tricarboxylate transporter substrate binding protein [Burkholderiales bacterium]
MKSLVFVACLLVAAAASAQPYPSKPIHLIVPLVPGGNQDIMARAVAEGVSKGLGQQIVVENRPGQSAIIGTQAVKSAPPDGYTLLSTSVTFARVPAIVKAANYDPANDFTGVSLICRIPQVLVVNPTVPANNVHELIALAKAKPGELTFGGSGNGSTGHVAAELFMQMTGTKLTQVPYKGNAQALVDVMGGQITMMFDQISTSMPHMRAGKVRALAVTTLARSPLFPDLPTLDESGLKGYEDVTWNGFVAPAGTPREVLARLHGEIAKVVNEPAFHKRWLERGIETGASASPQDFSAYIKREADAFARLAREAGIKAD